MARLEGFEPPTLGFEVRCSIRAELQAHLDVVFRSDDVHRHVSRVNCFAG